MPCFLELPEETQLTITRTVLQRAIQKNIIEKSVAFQLVTGWVVDFNTKHPDPTEEEWLSASNQATFEFALENGWWEKNIEGGK